MGFRVIDDSTVRGFRHHQQCQGLFSRHRGNFTISICAAKEIATFDDHAVTHLLSILDRKHDPLHPPCWIETGNHYSFQFDDIEHDSHDRIAPTREDVERILQVGRNLANQSLVLPVHLLIHCPKGVSRSTAAALAILMQIYGPGREQDAVRHLFEVRPQAIPNRRMIRETDLILGCGGQLVAAVAWA